MVVKLFRCAGSLGLLGLPLGANAASVYALLNGSSAEIGTLDLSSGVYTNIGSLTLNSASVNIDSLAKGSDGTLYASATADGNLYTVNTTNGNLTLVGALTSGPLWMGSTTSGLYGLTGSNLSSLYSVNGQTAAATSVGSTGGSLSMAYFAMSTHSPTLYLADSATASSDSLLYTLNTATGSPTLIGDMGITGVDALTMVNGTLYATSDTNNALYTVDVGIGTATLVTPLSGTTGFGLYGLADTSPVPETQTSLAMTLGLLGSALGWRHATMPRSAPSRLSPRMASLNRRTAQAPHSD